MSATRTVVSIEMLYLFSNMKDTISNLNYKILEAAKRLSLVDQRVDRIRHATLMHTCAYDNGTLLLFEVTNNVIKQFI